ncbi:MAG: PEP-utilizing enzyme [Planctomycetota bacterium]|nr:PEP-utilizing enzyme [Planctomycetota bacterium]
MSEESPGKEAPADEARSASDEALSPGGPVLRGATVAPGLILGHVHRKDYDLSRARAERAPLDEIDQELNRFRRALDDSRRQLMDLKARLEGWVKPDDARILDTHLTYLKDSVFIADVENLIIKEQMRLDAAISKVISDFDRIFRLVANDTLRQSAVDLRDVGIRVRRNLEHRSVSSGDAEPPPQEYVLVARELSIVDMFNLSNEHVQGIVTEEGALAGHAAIFARSMRIPTITGVQRLLDSVQEGDFVILDATEGVLRINPDDLVRQQYAAGEELESPREPAGVPDWAQVEPHTLDGETLAVLGACGNLPEVEQSSRYGLPGIGLYRTELLYLVDREPPSLDGLVHHYSAVAAASNGPVTFRLLNADAGLGLSYLHPQREPNPQLGRAGVRALLENETVLRRQLQAILLAGAEQEVRIAVPFVTDVGELRRVNEILFQERFELRKGGEDFQDKADVGAVVETPAAMLGIRDIAREAAFLLVNLDALVQYLLAADRESAGFAASFETLHPIVLRALIKAVEVTAEEKKELGVFGVTAFRPQNLSALVGIGVRRFMVSPLNLRDFLARLAQIDARATERAARAAAKSACPADAQSLVGGYRHGYAPP